MQMAESPLFVRSLEKALRLLDTFDGSSQYLSLSELAVRSGLDKSATQRFAHTLRELGYLERCPTTKRLALGKRTLSLSFSFLRANPLVEAATPTLVEMRRDCGERVNLSLYDRTTLIYAIRQQGKREYFDSSLVGRRMPTYCTAGGRAMLAHLPDEEIRAILNESDIRELTGQTITDPDRIMDKICEARRDGFATSHGECVVGEITIAAAVLDRSSKPIAAVHIAGFTGEITQEEFERRYAPLVVQAASSLSRH